MLWPRNLQEDKNGQQTPLNAHYAVEGVQVQTRHRHRLGFLGLTDRYRDYLTAFNFSTPLSLRQCRRQHSLSNHFHRFPLVYAVRIGTNLTVAPTTALEPSRRTRYCIAYSLLTSTSSSARRSKEASTTTVSDAYSSDTIGRCPG